MMTELDPISQLIAEHLPRHRRRRFRSDERLETDVGLSILMINELLEDLELEYDVKPPPSVRQSLAFRLAAFGGTPVRFDTANMTVGDLREAAEAGVWSERFFGVR